MQVTDETRLQFYRDRVPTGHELRSVHQVGLRAESGREIIIEIAYYSHTSQSTVTTSCSVFDCEAEDWMSNAESLALVNHLRPLLIQAGYMPPCEPSTINVVSSPGHPPESLN